MMENLVWKAYYHSMSGHEIRPFNIFEHGRFREEVRKLWHNIKSECKQSIEVFFWIPYGTT